MFILPALSFISVMLLATNQPVSPPVRSYYGDFLNDRGATDQGIIPGIPGPSVAPGAQDLSCRPNINTNRTMAVDIRPGLEPWYVNNVKHPEYNKETKLDGTTKEWILVKENAPIPAWKVWAGGNHCNNTPGRECGEMEQVGTSIAIPGDPTSAVNPDIGGDVFIGIGWCDDPANVPPPSGGGSTTDRIRNNGCLDPLTQDVLFVVTRRGATPQEADAIGSPMDCDGKNKSSWIRCHSWGRKEEMLPPKTQENLELYYWTFNVYISEEKLDADPTYEELPDWMKLQCKPGGGGDVWGVNRCSADPKCHCAIEPGSPGCNGNQPANQPVLGTFTTAEGNPRLVILNSELDNIDRSLIPPDITLTDTYISLGEVPGVDPSTDILLGTAYQNHFNVWLRVDTQSNISTANHAFILDPSIVGKPGPFFIFGPILSVARPEQHNLQLGTFNPGLPLQAVADLPTSLYYEWWTPSCKPALYLYPEHEQEVEVKVEPEGYITESIPAHGKDGWRVLASPDGRIVDMRGSVNSVDSVNSVNSAGSDPSESTESTELTDSAELTESTEYPYLYYEAAITKLAVSKDTGWIKTSDELLVFFADTLPKLGLNKTESHDFIEYWLPKLTDESDTWYITLIDEKEIDRVEPLTIHPEPDTTIRVRFYFEKIADSENLRRYSIHPVPNHPITQSPTINRTGFTLVDWGGIIGNGSCGIGEVSE